MDTPSTPAPPVLTREQAPALAKRHWVYVALAVATSFSDVGGRTPNDIGLKLFELLLVLCLFELAFVSVRFSWRRFTRRRFLTLAAAAAIAGAAATWAVLGSDAEPWYVIAVGAGLPAFALSFAVFVGLTAAMGARRP